jgi:hypothetical protein
VRPRFFAGQLLTEDDLSALIDYVVGKNRFHNSRLFGEGVVCGLLVECGPCDGQIVVEPGYALDCCGNDLVLTCKQTLDLAPMIRALAAKKDCGCTDPCSDPTVAQTANNSEKDPKPCKTYCLYARYAERPDQPVAAYPVGGDCDAASCEPTRIVEGITFELRCPTTIHHPNIHDAKQCCRDMVDSKALLDMAASLGHITGWIAEEYAPEISAALRDRLKESLEYDRLVAGLRGPTRHVAQMRYVASNYAALARAKPAELGLSADEVKQLEGFIKTAANELATVDLGSVSKLDAALIEAAAQASGKAELRSARSATPQAFFMNAPVMEAVHQALKIVSVQLQAAAGCGSPKVHTDCTLQPLLDSLAPIFKTTPEAHEIGLLNSNSLRAKEAIERFMTDCDCAAINPPCPPCDDPGVLLACIEVDGCKVVKICDTVREYVYAPSTLRYWDAIDLPYSGACCGERKGERPHKEVRKEIDNRFQLEQLASRSGAHPSMHQLMAHATTARDRAMVPQRQFDELEAKFNALAEQFVKFQSEKASTKKDSK